jgi:hypothetical protein
VDERLWPAAASSVLAHLNHLAAEGVVTAEGEAGPERIYRLAR